MTVVGAPGRRWEAHCGGRRNAVAVGGGGRRRRGREILFGNYEIWGEMHVFGEENGLIVGKTSGSFFF